MSLWNVSSFIFKGCTRTREFQPCHQQWNVGWSNVMSLNSTKKISLFMLNLVLGVRTHVGVAANGCMIEHLWG